MDMELHPVGKQEALKAFTAKAKARGAKAVIEGVEDALMTYLSTGGVAQEFIKLREEVQRLQTELEETRASFMTLSNTQARANRILVALNLIERGRQDMGQNIDRMRAMLNELVDAPVPMSPTDEADIEAAAAASVEAAKSGELPKRGPGRPSGGRKKAAETQPEA